MNRTNKRITHAVKIGLINAACMILFLLAFPAKKVVEWVSKTMKRLEKKKKKIQYSYFHLETFL